MKPIIRVLSPIKSRVVTSVDFRPTRSPRWPKITPPRGLAINPIVKVLKARIWPINGSNVGKKSLGKTRAAAVPYRKKSYHSMVVPTVLATTASTSARRAILSVDALSSIILNYSLLNGSYFKR
jgi:hypothetical protein